MRTTVDIPDQLFRLAKRVAADRGTTLREFVTQAVEHELAGRLPERHRQRNPIPTIRVPDDAPILHLTPEALAEADGEAEREAFDAVPGGR